MYPCNCDVSTGDAVMFLYLVDYFIIYVWFVLWK